MQPPASSVEPDLQGELARARIQIINIPGGGKGFYFPAARNVGNAVGVTIFWMVWTTAWLAVEFFIFNLKDFLALSKWILVIITSGIGGTVSLVFLVATINCWLKRVRVTVTRDAVTIARHWLVFGRKIIVPTGDIDGFSVEFGMQNNSKTYHAIKLAKRGGIKIPVITMILDQREADWIAQEMTTALGRQS